jgi:hypothetical protein
MVERNIRFILRHRGAVVIAVLVAPQLRHVHLEIRRHANMPLQHPFVEIENRISGLCWGDAVLVLGAVENRVDIITPEILGKATYISQYLSQPRVLVDSSLSSVAVLRVSAVVPGCEGVRDAQPRLRAAPESPAGIERLVETIRRNRLIHGNFAAGDEPATIIALEFDYLLRTVGITDRKGAIVVPDPNENVDYRFSKFADLARLADALHGTDRYAHSIGGSGCRTCTFVAALAHSFAVDASNRGRSSDQF